ncbi:MAG: preprotein translocase subunit SecA, partial [Paramuribaculum sp.]|nr:preprotein translocase subunit SecA [Paramuribaculum sp.]
MSLNSFLSKIFGNKSTRDLKEIQPIVDKIKALGPEMQELDNDALRQKITDVRNDIRDAVAPDEQAIAETKEKIEDLPFDQRQPLWDDIDRREKHILDIIEDKLNYHLPTVFAALRETAARFAANEEVVVTATQLDRDLAAAGKDFVRIEDDKAIYK